MCYNTEKSEVSRLIIKRLLALLLVLTLCITAGGCLVRNQWEDWEYSAEESAKPPASSDEEPDPDNSAGSPLLYKVTDANGHTLWLFGAIHVGREAMYPLPDYVMNAFDNADTLAVEVDMVAFNQDSAGLTAAVRQLRYPDGSLVTSHIPKELYDQAVELLTQHGSYNEKLIYYMPSLWSNYVDSVAYAKANVKSSLGVDRYLLSLAYQQKKEVYSIESGKFQYGLLASFSPELQQSMLEDSVEKCISGSVTQELEMLMDLWFTGDEAGLARLLTGSEVTDDPQQQALYDEYIDKMFTQRNDSMAQYAKAALLSGKEVFVCVGAGHIIGPNGIAQQLEDQGYTVRLIGK